MEMEKRKISSKFRLLYLYTLLMEGKILEKDALASHANCTGRSVERDFEDIRHFLEEFSVRDSGVASPELIYSRAKRVYKLEPPMRNLMSSEEIYAVLKILLESRAFSKKELDPIIDKIINCCVSKDEVKNIRAFIGNERLGYKELQHKKPLLRRIWELSAAVKEHKFVRLEYTRAEGKSVSRKVRPVGLMFSEFYFYLLAFIDTDHMDDTDIDEEEKKKIKSNPIPTVYRIDRIDSCEITDEHFKIDYQTRFEESWYRDRTLYMQSSELERIEFLYTGKNIDLVLDKLPTAEIIRKTKVGYLFKADLFGRGFDIWAQAQNGCVKVKKRRTIKYNFK